MRARCGTFLMFLETSPGEEAHRKPRWRMFPNACEWSPEAFGWYLVFLSALGRGICNLVPLSFELGSGENTVPMKTHISKLCTVRARCVQLPLQTKAIHAGVGWWGGGGG